LYWIPFHIDSMDTDPVGDPESLAAQGSGALATHQAALNCSISPRRTSEEMSGEIRSIVAALADEVYECHNGPDALND
jgi:hypothetical protein